jgi:Family of unknown function (DUF5715)
MNRKLRNLILLVAISAAICAGTWALVRFKPVKSYTGDSTANPTSALTFDPDLWARSVEKVKEERSESERTAIEIPTQLRHYENRHWFLATQVAEVKKFNLPSCHDYVELAAMIVRGELVSLPPVTNDYILFGVGARADDSAFDRYQDDHTVGLYDETQLRDAYSRIDATNKSLKSELSRLKSQLGSLKRGDRAKQNELRSQISAREQELQANEEDKAVLDQSYGQPVARQKLFQDYESLKELARSFAGRSFNLDNPTDRLTLKVSMLSSIRPEALKIINEVATPYREKFDRPLPVSSLVRPEQYQHALRRVNRNAAMIDIPPHTTGLAFDIDYRYMSGAEQTFLMAELARLEDQGRIEVIRERGANFHVFVFLDGKRPSDDMITASLEEAGAPVTEENEAVKEPAKVTYKSRNSVSTKSKRPVKSKSRRHR